MSFLLTPCPMLLAVLCGMANQRQQQIIEFQNAQIEALLNKLGCSEKGTKKGDTHSSQRAGKAKKGTPTRPKHGPLT